MRRYVVPARAAAASVDAAMIEAGLRGPCTRGRGVTLRRRTNQRLTLGIR